jgi:hypothetical protein
MAARRHGRSAGRARYRRRLARPAARDADPDVLEYLLAAGEAAAVTAANRPSEDQSA